MRILNIAFYVIVVVVILSSVLSAILQRPLLFSAIKSNSMYPLMQRGDLVMVSPVVDGKSCGVGDIVLFSAKEGPTKSLGWISHRIVGGNPESGFITKGDANELADQANGAAYKVKPEWISGKVVCIGKTVVKVPLAGFLPLLVEDYKQTSFILPVIAVLLAVIIGISEFSGKKKKSNNKLSYPAIYITAGMVLAVILCASMLSLSQHLSLKYNVGESKTAAKARGEIAYDVGERQTIKLADLSNQSFIPTVATITSDDSQLVFSDDTIVLNNKEKVKTTVTIEAATPGKYESAIHIGLFYPLLPASFIYALAKWNYWLALIVISLIPGLPLMVYPLIDSRMRAIVMKSFRRLTYKLRIN